MFSLGFRTSQSVGAIGYARVEIDRHLTGGSDSRQKRPTARAARADRQLLSHSVSLRRVTVVPRRVASLLSDLEHSRCLTEFQEAVVQKVCARYAWASYLFKSNNLMLSSIDRQSGLHTELGDA